MGIRKAAVAGTWYPGQPAALAAALDGHLAAADRAAADVRGDLVALIAPHAGLMYSGPVAAHAYRLLRDRAFDVAVLVGPSHFVGFDGVATYSSGGFETPFGVTPIDADGLQASLDARPEHACGGGPTVAVMRAARLAGARDAVILNYADSGDVSGDKSSVVGYLAAALGTFA